jgi:transposase
MSKKTSAEATIRTICRKTYRKHSAEDKIRIVLEGLRGEDTFQELCRREGIVASLYYKWSKDFLEAGISRLAGDTKRQATSSEVSELRSENDELKQVVAELLLKNRVLKKSLTASASEWDV